MHSGGKAQCGGDDGCSARRSGRQLPRVLSGESLALTVNQLTRFVFFCFCFVFVFFMAAAVPSVNLCDAQVIFVIYYVVQACV